MQFHKLFWKIVTSSFKRPYTPPFVLSLQELINTAICALLYFIAFVVQLAKWTSYPGSHSYGSNIAAGVFGVFNFLAYAAGTYFLYLAHKSGSNYQMKRERTKFKRSKQQIQQQHVAHLKSEVMHTTKSTEHNNTYTHTYILAYVLGQR